jgi:hypothetical protein
MSSRTRTPSIRIVPADEPEISAAAEALPLLATSMFCDDVRVESTGKLILVGCYPGNVIMLNQAQPVDRLWVFTKIIWPPDLDVTGMRLRIDMPAQEPGFITVQNAPAPSPDVSPGATCVWQLRFLPLRPGDVIRVGVEVGARIVHSGELIAMAPPVAPPITRH